MRHPVDARHRGRRLHRVRETQPQLPSVEGEVDAGEHHFPVACRRQSRYLLPESEELLGAQRPPGIGYDAVGAELGAAVLDL